MNMDNLMTLAYNKVHSKPWEAELTNAKSNLSSKVVDTLTKGFLKRFKSLLQIANFLKISDEADK